LLLEVEAEEPVWAPLVGSLGPVLLSASSHPVRLAPEPQLAVSLVPVP